MGLGAGFILILNLSISKQTKVRPNMANSLGLAVLDASMTSFCKATAAWYGGE